MTMLCNDELSFIGNGPYPIILIIYNISHIMNITVYYIGKLLKEQIPKVLILRETFLLYLSEMIDDN